LRFRPQGLAANVALLLFSAAVSLLIGEAAVRLLNWRPASSQRVGRIANTRGASVRAGTVTLLCFPDNPRGYFPIDLRDPATRAHYESIGMRRLETTVDVPFAVESRFNSLVFRGPEFPPRRPGVRRIVVIGDSFTEGWGVKEEDAYPRVLGERLESAAPGRFEVLNCGRQNTDFPAMWFLFRRALELDPDIVVYGMTLTDGMKTPPMQERLDLAYNLPVTRGAAPSSRGPSVRVAGMESVLATLVRDAYQSRELNREMVRWYLDLYDKPNRQAWYETRQLIQKMNETMDERGGRFVLMLWPVLFQLESGYPLEPAHAKIAEFCGAKGIRLHDLLPTLRSRDSHTLWVHALDRHPNEVAHRVAAESLLPIVRGAQ
jgi:hypothetical protein